MENEIVAAVFTRTIGRRIISDIFKSAYNRLAIYGDISLKIIDSLSKEINGSIDVGINR